MVQEGIMYLVIDDLEVDVMGEVVSRGSYL